MMENGEITVRDILAEEGLGLSTFQLETQSPSLDSASLAKLLAMVTQETARLQGWWHQSSDRASEARKCHFLAVNIVDDLSSEEMENYHRILVIGYLSGQQIPTINLDKKDDYLLATKGINGLSAREEGTYRRLFKIGYLYGRITNPGKKSINKGAIARIETMKANIKRSEGGRAVAEKRRAAVASRKSEAKKMWDELAATGRQPHEIAQVIAARMGVTAKTVREWRRSGWG